MLVDRIPLNQVSLRKAGMQVGRIPCMDASNIIEYIDDPALALDSKWRVQAANAAFAERLYGAALPDSIDSVFDTNQELAEEYADTLRHYPDVGGAIEGENHHFDPTHDTVAALHSHQDPQENDPDMGVFVDGELYYFELEVVDSTDSGGRLLVCRDITRIKDRQQDLDFLRQVMERVLRHNLRNDLSVIRGQASVIADINDGEEGEMAEAIKTKSDDLLETSEKTRLIQRAVERPERIDHHLPGLVEHSVEHALEAVPDADTNIETDIIDTTVSAIPEFRDALADTVENAVRYGEGGTAEVTASRQGEWVTISVADEGPGIPEHELEALKHRGETQHTHGSGAGLWLLYTTVLESRGDVSFETEEGTTVRVRLPTGG